MKDYKRLTDSETAKMLKNTEGESWDSDNIEAQCYIRLAELEDKIERGEIDYVAEWKRRVEVLEMALTVAVRDFNCGDCPYIGCSPKIRAGSKECISRLCTECKRQAEREIEEKRK